jgi:hypothetical protein
MYLHKDEGVRGLLRKMNFSRSDPLTHVGLVEMAVLPSPARGEGANTTAGVS